MADFRCEARLEESNQRNKKINKKAREWGAASTPANGIVTSGIKEAHLDDFLVAVC